MKTREMRFLATNILIAVVALLLIHTLQEPWMVDSARLSLTAVVLFLAVMTPCLEWWLRPENSSSSGAQVRKVMGVTMIKMFSMLILVVLYLFIGGPSPLTFGLAVYLVYVAFTVILVVETMRHKWPPTDPR